MRASHFFQYLVLLCISLLNRINGARYEPKWESLDKRPIPTWYDEAKIGIFLHWGVYSVPSMGSEWFWQYWKDFKRPEYVDFMQRNYAPNYSYQDFAKNFKAELFNATQWALLFRDSGAKYVVLTSKHHEGFTLWPSQQAFSWNAVDVGPKRDIIKEFSVAIRQHSDLKFGVYYSLLEWFNRMYMDDMSHAFTTQTFVNSKVRPEQLELVKTYLPEIFWSDGDSVASDKYWKSEEFVAWLYNDSPVSETIVVNDRWGNGTSGRHGDFYNYDDRYNPGVLQHHKWENAFTLDKTSWGHRFDTTLKDFMTPEELIKEIVTTISCGGNVLINVGPTQYGTIQPIFEERLREMGEWLQINGEAMYGSRPWTYQNDSITAGVWYTTKTNASSHVTSLYATVLEYPYDTNELTLYPFGKSINESPTVSVLGLDLLNFRLKDTIANVTLLGMENTKIEWHLEHTAILIKFPPKNHIDKRGLKYGWTFKIELHDNFL